MGTLVFVQSEYGRPGWCGAGTRPADRLATWLPPGPVGQTALIAGMRARLEADGDMGRDVPGGGGPL